MASSDLDRVVVDLDIDLDQYHYTTCRTFGHAWEPADVKRKGGIVSIVLSCHRCGTHRIDEVSSATSSIYSRRYDYPEDYRHHAAARDEFRQAFIHQRILSSVRPVRTKVG